MTINLSSYKNVETAIFVKMVCNHYVANPGDTPVVQTMTFSQYDVPVTIDGVTYAPLGNLLGISETTSELRVSPGQLTITISGIPNSSIAEIVNSRIRGSTVEIWRMFFDPVTKQPLNIAGNPMGRFQGIVNNYALDEQYSGSATNTILLTCSSTIEVLSNKIAGRATNPIDQKQFFPNDLSMDRVPNLAKSNFNFGAVVK